MYSACMEKKSLQVWLPDEIHEQLDQIAKNERRSKGAQAAVMLERELLRIMQELTTAETQISMPTTAEDREAMMERIR